MAEETRAPAPYTEADLSLIKRIIPHRYPFLFIDRVRDIVPHEGGVGIKMVTCNEPHFQGHFPEEPVMPGVTIVEAMAQTSAVIVGISMNNHRQAACDLFHGHRQVQVPPHGGAG